MKIDKILEKDDEVRTEITQKKQVEYAFIGSQRKIRGLTLFEYNPYTKTLRKAKIIKCDTIDFVTKQPLRKDRVEMTKGCVYIQALNRKNALRKIEYSKKK